MEQSYSSLPIKTISNVTNEAVGYIKARKEHTIRSLRTRWPKLNKCMMGGIEPNVVITITGISGSGKSSIANTLETDIIDLNRDCNPIVLSFTIEMLSFRQIGRKLSNKLRKTTSDLYSSSADLDDNTFKEVLSTAKSFSEYSIYYVDVPGTPEQVKQTIMNFYNKYVKGTNRPFVVIYDHALLTTKVGSMLDTISDLQSVFIAVKKLHLTSVIELSQMNRNIESPERIINPSNHFPMRSDISSSDSIFQASDYVLVVHRPELLGIISYGPHHWLVENKIYIHILKNRDAGKPTILQFENDLKYNNLIEIASEESSTNNKK